MNIGRYLSLFDLPFSQFEPIGPFELVDYVYDKSGYYVPSFKDLEQLTILNYGPPSEFAKLVLSDDPRDVWFVNNYDPHLLLITGDYGPVSVTLYMGLDSDGFQVFKAFDRVVYEFDFETLTYLPLSGGTAFLRPYFGNFLVVIPSLAEVEYQALKLETIRRISEEQRKKSDELREQQEAARDRAYAQRMYLRDIEWAYTQDQWEKKPRFAQMPRVSYVELENRKWAKTCIPYEILESGIDITELLEKAKNWVALKRKDDYKMRPWGKKDTGEALSFNVACDMAFKVIQSGDYPRTLHYGTIVQGIAGFQLRYDCDAFKIFKENTPGIQKLYAERKAQHWKRTHE